jgi:Arc/MetJ-type ribon-helix-helix transcriptional regulator
MISARLPAALVARLDFVVRNNDGDVRSRSEALQTAVEGWLPAREERLVQLGILPKKARQQAP